MKTAIIKVKPYGFPRYVDVPCTSTQEFNDALSRAKVDNALIGRVYELHDNMGLVKNTASEKEAIAWFEN